MRLQRRGGRQGLGNQTHFLGFLQEIQRPILIFFSLNGYRWTENDFAENVSRFRLADRTFDFDLQVCVLEF